MAYIATASKLTYEDYADAPDDERYELIDGELIMVPSPGEVHQSISFNLSIALGPVAQSGLGRFYAAPFDVVLSPHDVVQPDLLFVAAERADIITAANVQGAPDLVVEILSPSTAQRDWNQKRELYARHGVREIWIVDPEPMTVWQAFWEDGRFSTGAIHSEGGILISPTLGGFAVNLSEVF